MQTLSKSVCHCASVWRSSHQHLWQACHCTVTTSCWKWSSKSPSMQCPRLQQMLLHIQKFDYTIQYKPGKEMVLADCLSCFPFHSNLLPFPILQNFQHVQVSNAELDIVWDSVECISVYSTVYHLTFIGWPQLEQQVPQDHQTLLGSPGWTVHQCWPTPHGDMGMHLPGTA